MSILQELENSLLSDAQYYMEFLYRYNPKKKQVFAFYEGDEDSSFYHNIISSILDQDCELEEIVTGCKNNVLKLQREFDWTVYKKEQIAFFVDKDLSFWLGESTDYDDNVFVTDDYSVENYVANAYGFWTWLIHFEGFARASKPEIEFMVEEYENVASRFQREMMPIMARAVVAKRHNKSISLSEFKISKDNNILFKIVNGHLSFDFQIDPDVFKKWGLTEIHNEEIEKQLYHFSEQKECYSVRGKWYLRFMAEVGEYMRLNPDIFASSLGITKKIKPTCAVAPSECLTAIAPYFVKLTPPRLEKFLDSTYRQYCLFFS